MSTAPKQPRSGGDGWAHKMRDTDEEEPRIPVGASRPLVYTDTLIMDWRTQLRSGCVGGRVEVGGC